MGNAPECDAGVPGKAVRDGCTCEWSLPRDASEGKGPQRWPQRRLDRRLEEVATAVGGGYCRLQMPFRLVFGVRGQWLGIGWAPWGGGGPPLLMHPCPSLLSPLPQGHVRQPRGGPPRHDAVPTGHARQTTTDDCAACVGCTGRFRLGCGVNSGGAGGGVSPSSRSGGPGGHTPSARRVWGIGPTGPQHTVHS